jgi:hypothetical protein
MYVSDTRFTKQGSCKRTCVRYPVAETLQIQQLHYGDGDGECDIACSSTCSGGGGETSR